MGAVVKIISTILFLYFEIEVITAKKHAEDNSNKIEATTSNELLTKIQLTQKGYIQFLRYIEDVPSLTEYTFCIWIKSYNFTFSHTLLSYSRHEEERLISLWITPHGKGINLEIHGISVFQIPVFFKEHQWYHICQSWSSEDATWELFVNKKRIRGYAPKLHKLHIKSGGDIVVGQEYTDFDKGLEDGIEGEIFGFNFVLSSTSSYQKLPKPYRQSDLEYFENLILVPSKKFWSNGTQVFFARRRRRGVSGKSLGLKLVEMSADCRVGKGAPLHGKNVLINWTKTTVRVFGGAIVKHVKPFC